MLFTIPELRLRAIPFSKDYPQGSLQFSDVTEFEFLSAHAEGVAELANERLGEVRLRGRVQARVKAICDRCLEEFVLPVDEEFDWTFLPVSLAPDAPEREMKEPEAEVSFYGEQGIPLEEIVRENILLAVPMQFLCRDDCQGICPVCGKNRNQGPCQCRPERSDDRWAALRAFKPSRGA